MIRIVLGFGGFLLTLFPFGFFFPLVSPWRLGTGHGNGKAKTLDGAQAGKATIRVSTTQSCPN